MVARGRPEVLQDLGPGKEGVITRRTTCGLRGLDDRVESRHAVLFWLTVIDSNL